MTKGRLHRQWNFSLEGGWFPLRWRMGRIFKKQEEGRNTDKRTIMSNFKKWNRWACKVQDSGEGNGLVIRNNWLLRENGRERGFVSLIQSLTSLLLLRFIEDTNWEENKIISISQNVSHLNQDKLLPDLKTKASKFLLEDQGLRPYVPAVFSTLRLQFTALYWTNIGSYKETWPQMNHFSCLHLLCSPSIPGIYLSSPPEHSRLTKAPSRGDIWDQTESCIYTLPSGF